MSFVESTTCKAELVARISRVFDGTGETGSRLKYYERTAVIDLRIFGNFPGCVTNTDSKLRVARETRTNRTNVHLSRASQIFANCAFVTGNEGAVRAIYRATITLSLRECRFCIIRFICARSPVGHNKYHETRRTPRRN